MPGDPVHEPDETFRVAIHAVNAVVSRAAGTADRHDDFRRQSPRRRPGYAAGRRYDRDRRCRRRLRDADHARQCYTSRAASPATRHAAGRPSTACRHAAAGRHDDHRDGGADLELRPGGDRGETKRGDSDLDLSAGGAATPAPGSAVYGLALDPKLGLAWTTAGGVVLSGRISPRFGTVNARRSTPLLADEAGGLHRDQLGAGACRSCARSW